jgi:hypothetical protein
MKDNLSAVQNALMFIGGPQQSTAAVKSHTVPTAKTRAALDLLSASTAEQLAESQASLRELASDLFNWSEEPKATKNVMRALGEALNTPNKYSHAVELTAYIAALVPLLQPDRLVRLFGAIAEVETAFAPSKYTLQLAHKLRRLLERFPEERREKLAYSLWVESHSGRWWDLTAGQKVAEAPNHNDVLPQKAMLELFAEHKLAWNPATAAAFKKIKPSTVIRESLEEYNKALMKEKVVDPDVAVLASYLDWLTPLERPESPVGSLLDNLHEIITAIEYDIPEKPKSFSAMFPNIKLYGNTEFPFPNTVLSTNGKALTAETRLEVVNNAALLADNRTFMGNCTWSYKYRMEKGEYVLFRIHEDTTIYNASMILNSKGKWIFGEINSRFNRSEVPAKVREAFKLFVGELPLAQADNNATKTHEMQEKIKQFNSRKYRYKI